MNWDLDLSWAKGMVEWRPMVRQMQRHCLSPVEGIELLVQVMRPDVIEEAMGVIRDQLGEHYVDSLLRYVSQVDTSLRHEPDPIFARCSFISPETGEYHAEFVHGIQTLRDYFGQEQIRNCLQEMNANRMAPEEPERREKEILDQLRMKTFSTQVPKVAGQNGPDAS